MEKINCILIINVIENFKISISQVSLIKKFKWAEESLIDKNFEKH